MSVYKLPHALEPLQEESDQTPASCLIQFGEDLRQGAYGSPVSQPAQVHHQLSCPSSALLPLCPRVSPASSSTIQPDWLSSVSLSVPRGTSRKGELRLTRCFWIKKLPGLLTWVWTLLLLLLLSVSSYSWQNPPCPSMDKNPLPTEEGPAYHSCSAAFNDFDLRLGYR